MELISRFSRAMLIPLVTVLLIAGCNQGERGRTADQALAEQDAIARANGKTISDNAVRQTELDSLESRVNKLDGDVVNLQSASDNAGPGHSYVQNADGVAQSPAPIISTQLSRPNTRRSTD
jgi:hypothetical protein